MTIYEVHRKCYDNQNQNSSTNYSKKERNLLEEFRNKDSNSIRDGNIPDEFLDYVLFHVFGSVNTWFTRTNDPIKIKFLELIGTVNVYQNVDNQRNMEELREWCKQDNNNIGTILLDLAKHFCIDLYEKCQQHDKNFDRIEEMRVSVKNFCKEKGRRGLVEGGLQGIQEVTLPAFINGSNIVERDKSIYGDFRQYWEEYENNYAPLYKEEQRLIWNARDNLNCTDVENELLWYALFIVVSSIQIVLASSRLQPAEELRNWYNRIILFYEKEKKNFNTFIANDFMEDFVNYCKNQSFLKSPDDIEDIRNGVSLVGKLFEFAESLKEDLLKKDLPNNEYAFKIPKDKNLEGYHGVRPWIWSRCRHDWLEGVIDSWNEGNVVSIVIEVTDPIEDLDTRDDESEKGNEQDDETIINKLEAPVDTKNNEDDEDKKRIRQEDADKTYNILRTCIQNLKKANHSECMSDLNINKYVDSFNEIPSPFEFWEKFREGLSQTGK